LMGIVNGEDFQIVYSDTPGILKPAYKLQQAMMKFVETALEDADIILYVTDTVETPNKNQEFLNKLQQLGKPIVLAINKVDLTTQEKVQELFNLWSTMMPNATVIPISALHGFNLNSLVDFIRQFARRSRILSKDTLTDKTLRFFASEIIREKILNNYRKEIPYSVEVEIEQYTESDTIDRIKAIIYVERESQKSILIGHQGNMLKKVGTEARLELEAFLGKKVYLELFVKVNENWRNDTSKLKRFGYPL